MNNDQVQVMSFKNSFVEIKSDAVLRDFNFNPSQALLKS